MLLPERFNTCSAVCDIWPAGSAPCKASSTALRSCISPCCASYRKPTPCPSPCEKRKLAGRSVVARPVLWSKDTWLVATCTSAAVGSDPYVLEEAAAAFHEFGGARGTHGEFRTVAHYLREAKSRRALLHAGRHSRRHLLARLA